MRRLVRFVLLAVTLTTFAASLWVLSQNPFAAPFVARTADEARAALTRALTIAVTEDWLVVEVEAALAGDDMDRLGLAIELSQRQGVPLPRPVMERALAASQAADAPLRRVADCAACAWDPAACASIRLIMTCGLPVEVTPLGDINALRRAGADIAAGRAVDRVEAGLALTGLAATTAILVTGGSSAAIKAGATGLRVARRMGTLTPPLTRQLEELSKVNLVARRVPAYLAGRAPLDEVADATKLARLGRVAEDFGSLAAETSVGDALVLLRYAETTDDVADLARLGRAQGPATRGTIHALGKARTFRMLNRLTQAALAAVALLAALAGQVLAWMLWLLRWAVRPTKV